MLSQLKPFLQARVSFVERFSQLMAQENTPDGFLISKHSAFCFRDSIK